MSATRPPGPLSLALVSAAALALASALVPRPAEARSRAARAESLYQQALAYLRENTYDSRRQAIERLERATLLEPGTAEYELTLGRTYYQAGYLLQARNRFTRVAQLEPADAAARFGLAQVWRRDWLKYLEPRSLERAISNGRAAVKLSPSNCDAWLLLAPLLTEQGDSTAAAAAASSARLSDPKRPEALIADAYTSYHMGRLGHADSAFAAGIPRLPRLARERFEDIAPVASERDTMTLHRLPAGEQAAFVSRFWKEHDPDLATPENEAQLEYWSRVSHAYFLYFDAKRREWDERGEVFVRYGPPASADYNPVGEKLYTTTNFGMVLPANILIWNYPALGMEVLMQDQSLSEYYLLPMSPVSDMDPAPEPDSLARLTGALVTRGGRGVFHSLPPGVRSRPADGALARFEGKGGPRLLAAFEAAGLPDDSLWAEYVVLDSASNEIGRQGSTLVPSACDPAGAQVAEFAAEYPPGQYQVGITVRDQHGGRGIFRAPVQLANPGVALALSDVVIPCGLPVEAAAGEAPMVRLEPNPGARVRGPDPLTAYFEIYHLRIGRDGRSRFEYVYNVRSAERDRRIWIQRAFRPRREPPPITASREEEQAGSIRRQFVRVPVQSLPAGRYRLEITVRDLLAATEVRAEAQFVRIAERAPGN